MDTYRALGTEQTCLYCGRSLTNPILPTKEEVERGVPALATFCSAECSRAYSATMGEDLEESEEIERAGAT